MRRLLFAWVAFGLGAGPGALLAEEDAWSRFGIGSYVRLKTTSVTHIAGKRQEMVTEVKQTLVSRDGGKTVVEFEQSIQGMPGMKNRVEIPSSVGDETTPKPSRTGTDSVTVAGRVFRSTWQEMTTRTDDSQTYLKVWMSDAMPGGLVKSLTRQSFVHGIKSEITAEVVEFLVK
jgi:hypothetical protein